VSRPPSRCDGDSCRPTDHRGGRENRPSGRLRPPAPREQRPPKLVVNSRSALFRCPYCGSTDLTLENIFGRRLAVDPLLHELPSSFGSSILSKASVLARLRPSRGINRWRSTIGRWPPGVAVLQARSPLRRGGMAGFCRQTHAESPRSLTARSGRRCRPSTWDDPSLRPALEASLQRVTAYVVARRGLRAVLAGELPEDPKAVLLASAWPSSAAL